MAVEHSSLTGNQLHEPKGVAAAASGQVYVANGSGSGVWKPLQQHVSVHATTPSSTFTLSTGTSDILLQPTSVTTASAVGFTVQSPLTLTYTGTAGLIGMINLTMSAKISSGTSHDVEWAIFKGSTELGGTRGIRAVTTSWGSISLAGTTALAQNDIISIKTKSDASATSVVYGKFNLSILGVAS